MKTLADFKRRLQVGVKVHAHNNVYNKDFGIREISIVQSNSFAFKTVKPDGTVVNSWCEHPKAKDFEVKSENCVLIYWGDGNNREVVLTYTFV